MWFSREASEAAGNDPRPSNVAHRRYWSAAFQLATRSTNREIF